MRQLLKHVMLLITLMRPAVTKYLEDDKKAEPEDELMNSKQACEFLFMSERTLRRRRKAGQIASITICRIPLIYKKELQRYRDENII